MEFSLRDALVLVMADTGNDMSAKVTDATGWTDLSAVCKGVVALNPTRETTRLQPVGTRRRGRALAGAGGGTVSLSLIRQDGDADEDPAAFFDAIEATSSSRFHVCIQPLRPPLVANNVVTPAPSNANPQYLTSVIMTGQDAWGPGGLETAIMKIDGDLDSDYAVYRA